MKMQEESADERFRGFFGFSLAITSASIKQLDHELEISIR